MKAFDTEAEATAYLAEIDAGKSLGQVASEALRRMARDDATRLRALLEVACDPTAQAKIPPSWWVSFGRECAEALPAILDAFDVPVEKAAPSLLSEKAIRSDDTKSVITLVITSLFAAAPTAIDLIERLCADERARRVEDVRPGTGHAEAAAEALRTGGGASER